MSARTKKKKAEETEFRASEEIKEVLKEGIEPEVGTLIEAPEVRDEASEKAGEVMEEAGSTTLGEIVEVRDEASEEVIEAGARTYFCTNCGKELDTESYFCPRCGVRTESGVKAGLAIPWTSDPYLRRELDVALQKASKAIDEGVRTVQETFREFADEVEKGVKEARTRAPVICGSCGQENTRYAKFCSRCGKQL
jgi:hypothetical protein